MADTGMIISCKTSAVECLQIRWKIPEYFALPEASHYVLHSAPFLFANASWCLRLYPNDPAGMKVSVLRLHSVVSRHEIITQFDAKLGGIMAGHNYEKYYYDELNVERKYFITAVSRKSKLVSFLKDKTVPLELVCHLLKEEATENENILQKCDIDFSKIYDRIDEQKDFTTMSLISSVAKSLRIMWKIPEYFALPTTPGYSVNSTSFDFGCVSWFLKLYPNGMEDTSNAMVSLVRSHSSIPYQKTICKFSVTADEIAINTNNVYENFEFNENTEKLFRDSCQNIPSRSAFFLNQTKFAPKSNMTFLFHLILEESTENHEEESMVNKVEFGTHPVFKIKKSKDFFSTDSLFDLTLEVQDRSFKVHKFMLSAQSSVFAAKILSNNPDTSTLVLRECDPNTIEDVLFYLYNGKLKHLSHTNVDALYEAADKFEIQDLKEECIRFKREGLSRDYISDFLAAA